MPLTSTLRTMVPEFCRILGLRTTEPTGQATLSPTSHGVGHDAGCFGAWDYVLTKSSEQGSLKDDFGDLFGSDWSESFQSFSCWQQSTLLIMF